MLNNAKVATHKQDGSFLSLPLFRLFPTFITLMALCFGLSSVLFTFIGRLEVAVIFIIVAAFLDGIDGKIARLLGCASTFGAQLDSLADLLNFGVAPAVMLYFWALKEIKFFGWALVMLFVISVAIRLARYNTNLIDDDKNLPTWCGNFFSGVPAPAAAILAIMPIMVSFENLSYLSFFENKIILCFYIFLVSIMTVSLLPTFSFKKVSIKRDYIPFLLTAFCFFVISIIIKPWFFIPLWTCVYIMLLPASIFYYYYLQSKNI